MTKLRTRRHAHAPMLLDAQLLRRLLRAKDRMDASPHEDWTLERMAAISAVSPGHFARSFKQAYGAPPHRYLLSIRIERAAALLRETEMSVTEIAFETGWSSLGTFGRTFRDVTGESPLQARAAADLGHTHAAVPACFARAGRRPELITSVLEKRRNDQGATT